jgi:hypothetical protein
VIAAGRPRGSIGRAPRGELSDSGEFSIGVERGVSAVRFDDRHPKSCRTYLGMSAWVFHRIVVLALLVPSGVVLAGCATSTAKPPSAPSDSASAGSCSSGYVAAQIGGDPKCLHNGQQCQQRWVSDYARYGFTCTKRNGKYELGTK